MKKYLILLALFALPFIMMAQSKPTAVQPDGYLTEASYFYIWGSTSDTLEDATSTNFVFRVRSNDVPNLKISLYMDHVSGTAGGTLIPYVSPDGVNYVALGDTITVAGLVADGLESETILFDDFLYPYLKLIYTQTGTAVTVPKMYGMMRYN